MPCTIIVIAQWLRSLHLLLLLSFHVISAQASCCGCTTPPVRFEAFQPMSWTRPLTKRPGNAAHFSSIVDDSNAQTNSQPVLCAREKGPKNVFLSSLPSFCFFTIKNTSKRNQMVCVPDCYGGAVRLNLPALDGNALYFNLKCIIAGWVKCTLELKCFTVCCW